jgi:hypothetical protein
MKDHLWQTNIGFVMNIPMQIAFVKNVVFAKTTSMVSE